MQFVLEKLEQENQRGRNIRCVPATRSRGFPTRGRGAAFDSRVASVYLQLEQVPMDWSQQSSNQQQGPPRFNPRDQQMNQRVSPQQFQVQKEQYRMAGGKDNGGKTMENRGKGITMTNNRSLVSLMSSYLISDSYIENSCISKDLTNNNEKWNNKNSSNLDKHINNIDSNNINNSAKNNSADTDPPQPIRGNYLGRNFDPNYHRGCGNRGGQFTRQRGSWIGRQHYWQQDQQEWPNAHQNNRREGSADRGPARFPPPDNRQRGGMRARRGSRGRRGGMDIEHSQRLSPAERNSSPRRRQQLARLNKFQQGMAKRTVPARAVSQQSEQEQADESMSEEEYESNKQSQEEEYDSDELVAEGEDKSEEHEGEEEDDQVSREDESVDKSVNERPSAKIVRPRFVSTGAVSDLDEGRATDEMCSKAEFAERMTIFQLNNHDPSTMKLDTGRSFSIFEINKRTNLPDIELALKRFRRSTDRSEGEEQSETKDLRRSTVALEKVMQHINREIIDSDRMSLRDLAFPLPPGEKEIQFMHIYDFLWDRMREMVKDISRLGSEDRMSGPMIEISEQMLRFFILAINEGRKRYNTKLQFDEKMNRQSITKILTPLMEIYESNRIRLKQLVKSCKEKNQDITAEQIKTEMLASNIYISPNEPQIVSYAIIISMDIQNTLNEKILSGFDAKSLENPLFSSVQVTQGIEIKKAICDKNFEKYHRILNSDKIDYVLSCIMLQHVHMMRKDTARMLLKNYCFKGARNTISLEELRRTLGFKEKQKHQFLKFLPLVGAVARQEEGTVEKGSEKYGEQSYHIPAYQFDCNKLDRKLYGNVPCGKLITNKQLISRQQLIKNTWKISNYVEELIHYYLGVPFVDVSCKKKNTQKSNESGRDNLLKKDIAEKVQVKETKPNQSKNISLQARKLELQRRKKFLRELSNLVTELFLDSSNKNNDRRKKGVISIFESVLLVHDRKLKYSLNNLLSYCNKLTLIQSSILKLSSSAQYRKKFLTNINKQSYEFQPILTSQKDTRKMSMVLQNVRKSKHSVRKITGLALPILIPRLVAGQMLLNKSSGKHFQSVSVRIIVIFKNQHDLNNNQEKLNFLKNIWSHLTMEHNNSKFTAFLTELSKDSQGNVQYYDYNRQLLEGQPVSFHVRLAKMNFNPRDGDEFTVPVICGYDPVLFVDFDGQFREIDGIIGQYLQNKERMNDFIGSNKQFNKSFKIINIRSADHASRNQTSLSSQRPYSTTIFKANYSRQVESKQLSPLFKFSLQQSVNKVISKPLPASFELRVLSSLLEQISTNLQCVSRLTENATPELAQQIKRNNLVYYQQYYNFCIRQLKEFVRNVFSSYQLYPDWEELLAQINNEKSQELLQTKEQRKTRRKGLSNDPFRQPDCEQRIIKEAQFLCDLFTDLQLSIAYSSPLQFSSLYNSNMFAVHTAVRVEQFLKKFDYCKIDCQHYERTELIEYLITNSEGEYKRLFEVILRQLAVCCRKVNCVVASNFKFEIRKKDYLRICQKIIEAERGKEWETAKIVHKPQAPDQNKSFKYERMKMLEEHKKKIKLEV